MITRRDVFQAIADPTRRQIISRISKEPLTMNAVAEAFEISRQAVSKHMQILSECGLVVMRTKGRERFCEARLDKLHEVTDWVAQYKKFMETKLDGLEHYLHKLQKQKKYAKRNK